MEVRFGEFMKMYLAIDDNLVIRNSEGTDLWRGQPEEKPVAWATPIPDSDDGLVLYEPYPAGWQKMSGFQNLVRVSAGGSVLWHADLPENGTKYVRAKLTASAVRAFAPSYEVDIDFETGKILKQIFTK